MISYSLPRIMVKLQKMAEVSDSQCIVLSLEVLLEALYDNTHRPSSIGPHEDEGILLLGPTQIAANPNVRGHPSLAAGPPNIVQLLVKQLPVLLYCRFHIQYVEIGLFWE